RGVGGDRACRRSVGRHGDARVSRPTTGGVTRERAALQRSFDGELELTDRDRSPVVTVRNAAERDVEADVGCSAQVDGCGLRLDRIAEEVDDQPDPGKLRALRL